ncbi:transient receptor potential cation channel subfamily M member 3 [Paragonimus westermani]|uniref:Transient receptor potential cation channel subfamily M member 3 n=1 Tax=Paragonimus westermani TaxID=34504 RepID=A0A5J4NFM5_9TREM|nr:transient receptor potential cation channel subfamily M member 3 [Paragonimus westermani]
MILLHPLATIQLSISKSAIFIVDFFEEVLENDVGNEGAVAVAHPAECIRLGRFVCSTNYCEGQGLIQAAITTEALIVTSGLNIGIVRMVGDALQEGQSLHFDRRRLSNQLRCLGIAPWGYVLNREELISDNFNLPVPYKVSTVIATGRPVSLNQNHTHYIFVDEGRRMRYGGSESAKFRARLCKKIAQSWKSGGWSIPVVLVVVEGGHDVFIDARDCIREHVPVVICSGTGRAADILSMASVYRLKHQEKEFKEFHAEEKLMLSRKLIPVSGAKKLKEAIEMISEIVHDPKLITTFDMNKSDDLDLAILYALIKTNSCLTTQLKLAFTWDRSDIAEEKIFQQGARVDPESLEPTMMDALLQDKPEFVRILLQNGVAMRQFLTLERIHRLYNESKNREGLEKFLIHKGLLGSQQTIRAVPTANAIEKDTLDIASNNNNINIEQQVVDTSENYSFPVYLYTISRLAKKTIGRFAHHVYELDTPELFLWAVLHQRQAMAMFFWEHSEDALTLSLIACVLYKEMVKALPNYDSERAELYGGYIDAFENLAVKVLDECNSVDPVSLKNYYGLIMLFQFIERKSRKETSDPKLFKSPDLLEQATGECCCIRTTSSNVCIKRGQPLRLSRGVRTKTGCRAECQSFVNVSRSAQDTTLYLIESETPLWGGYNCLNLADKATRRKFVSSVACQNSLNFAWSHGIQASTASLLLTLFCPIILLSETFLKFQGKRTSFVAERQNSIEEDENMKAASYEYDLVETNEQVTTSSTLEQHYSSRSSNFSNRSHPIRLPLKKKLEIFYTAPKVKFFLHTICVIPGSGKQKLKLWVKTYSWVYIDIIVVFLAIISMLLRIGMTTTFTWAKSFYAVTLIICYIRIFRLYGFHPALGPKLVMIQRMLTELLIFIFILVVILVSYGVAVQALLYPNQTEFDWNTVRDALYYPYWNLYGELNLEYSFGSRSVSKSTTQVRVFINSSSADESHPTQQTSNTQNAELKTVMNYEPYEEVQNDDGTELFGFLSMKSRRTSAARDLLGGNSAILGNLDLLRKFASATNVTETDEEMRIARLFETNCMHNYLKKQKLEKEKTVDAGISNIKTRDSYSVVTVLELRQADALNPGVPVPSNV